MININTVEDSFYNWAVANSGFPVRYRHQNAPQDKRAFIVIHIDSVTTIGLDFEKINSNGTKTVYSTKEFDVSVILFGTHNETPDNSLTPIDATGTLANLMTTLSKAEVHDEFIKSDVIILDYDPVIDTSYLEDSHWVERADSVIHCRTSTADTQVLETTLHTINNANIGYTDKNMINTNTGIITITGGQ